MKYLHLENELYVSIPALMEDIRTEFKSVSEQEESEATSNQLLSLNMLYTFLETITKQLADSMEPTND